MRTTILFLTLSLLVFSANAAEPATECALCAGAVSDLTLVPAEPIPLLVRVDGANPSGAEGYLAQLSPAQKSKTTVIVRAAT